MVTIIRLEECGLILSIAGIYRPIVEEEVGKYIEDINPNVKFETLHLNINYFRSIGTHLNIDNVICRLLILIQVAIVELVGCSYVPIGLNGSHDQAFQVRVKCSLASIILSHFLLLLVKYVESLRDQFQVFAIVQKLRHLHLKVVEDELRQKAVDHLFFAVFLFLVEFDGKRGEIKSDMPLVNGAALELLDTLVLDLQKLLVVAAVPGEQLVPLSLGVLVVDVQIETPQKVGVDLLLEVEFEGRRFDAHSLGFVEIEEVDALRQELVEK